ncbi:hypothetical protein [Achromobacter sp. DH1f]|uniref:hypothetical protein n=1 Tax=Achromobacter sp. DH1f TaxID=1397275 RepID=UPI0018E2D277|nr:hypothetical protein [Achromobacter sp. DH1f]
MKSQVISLSLAVDADHLSKAAREAFMNESGHNLLLWTPCKAAGHTLRSKAKQGEALHPMRYPRKLLNSYEVLPQAMYIQFTPSKNGCLKIGFSEVDPFSRHDGSHRDRTNRH